MEDKKILEEQPEVVEELPVSYNKHYITVDEQGRVVDGFSDAFRQPAETDICINEQGGYQFRLAPGGEENPALYDWNGMIPLYRWDGAEVIRRTAEEIEADRAAKPEPEAPPTTDQRVTELEEAMELLLSGVTE